MHSPSKRSSTLSSAYTVYSVTSLFRPSPEAESDSERELALPSSPARITVHRRFSHFVVLHTALSRRLPGIAFPPLPEKQYAGRFSNDFVEARRGDLERYIDRIVRHPVARYAEILMFFLGCESDLVRLNDRCPDQRYQAFPIRNGNASFPTIYHSHLRALLSTPKCSTLHSMWMRRMPQKLLTDLTAILGLLERAYKDLEIYLGEYAKLVLVSFEFLSNLHLLNYVCRLEMSRAERLLSYSLLSLITSKPLSSAPMTGISEEEEETNDKSNGLFNRENAWCWREGCEGERWIWVHGQYTDYGIDCLRLTKAMQKTSETLQNVADLYDDHVSDFVSSSRVCITDIFNVGEAYATGYARIAKRSRASLFHV